MRNRTVESVGRMLAAAIDANTLADLCDQLVGIQDDECFSEQEGRIANILLDVITDQRNEVLPHNRHLIS